MQAPVGGSYAFRVTGDDGVRLWVDDKAVTLRRTDNGTDSWRVQGATAYTSDPITLTGGKFHHIVPEYYENGGDATVKLEWDRPADGAGFGVVEQKYLYSDQQVLPAGVFATIVERQQGKVTAPAEGGYGFRASGAGDAEVWVNGISVHRRFAGQVATGPVTLEAGGTYRITVKDDTVDAAPLAVQWDVPGDAAGFVGVAPAKAYDRYAPFTVPDRNQDSGGVLQSGGTRATRSGSSTCRGPSTSVTTGLSACPGRFSLLN